MQEIGWNKNQIQILKDFYPDRGKQWCCIKLNKTEASVRYKASHLGLRINIQSPFFKEFQSRAAHTKVGKKRPDQSIWLSERQKTNPINKWTDATRKKFSISRKAAIVKFGHPRGMLGKKQTPETIARVVIGVKKAWRDPTRYCNSQEYRQRKSDNQSRLMFQRIQNHGSIYSRGNNGWYKLNGKRYFFRSSWEVNYARYLDWLVSKNEIEKWEYEPETFWFEAIRRGVRSYLPDFKIYNKNGSIEFHEVKGYMDDKSKTKISRMAKYYPSIKLIVIAKDEYKSVMKYDRLFPEAERELKN